MTIALRNVSFRGQSGHCPKPLPKTRRGRIAANIAKLPELLSEPQLDLLWRSILRARSHLLRRMRPRRRLIQIVSEAEPANSADSVQTLLKGYKATIRGRTGRRSILGAPRIVLRPSGRFDPEDCYENPGNEQQASHGRLLIAPRQKRQRLVFVSSPRAMRPGGSQPISPSCRSCCGGHRAPKTSECDNKGGETGPGFGP